MMKYFSAFFLAAIISFLLTPLSKKIAVKLNAIDVPDSNRRIHDKPIPRMGGLAIFFSFIICSFSYIKESNIFGIILGSLIIVIAGVLDDIKSLKPLSKLIFQGASAIVLIIYGIKINRVAIPFFTENSTMDLGWLSPFATALWVVGVTNAVNLIDGLDGLACGIGIIASLSLSIVSLLNHGELSSMLSIILAGACLGFLPYNFNPAAIFLGDTGAQFIGFMLSSISIQGSIKSAAAVSIVVPIIALGLPIYDTVFAIIRRKVNNHPIMQADRGHFHHRLLDYGFTHKQVVLILYAVSTVLGLISILAILLSNRQSYTLLIAVFIYIILFGFTLGFFKHKK